MDVLLVIPISLKYYTSVQNSSSLSHYSLNLLNLFYLQNHNNSAIFSHLLLSGKNIECVADEGSNPVFCLVTLGTTCVPHFPPGKLW